MAAVAVAVSVAVAQGEVAMAVIEAAGKAHLVAAVVGMARPVVGLDGAKAVSWETAEVIEENYSVD